MKKVIIFAIVAIIGLGIFSAILFNHEDDTDLPVDYYYFETDLKAYADRHGISYLGLFDCNSQFTKEKLASMADKNAGKISYNLSEGNYDLYTEKYFCKVFIVHVYDNEVNYGDFDINENTLIMGYVTTI